MSKSVVYPITKNQVRSDENGYHYRDSKAEEIHAFARESVSAVPASDAITLIITQGAATLNALAENAHALQLEMKRIAEMLPEYETVKAILRCGAHCS